MTAENHVIPRFDTSRLETLCDGVFAIAMTLLVLELRLPHPGESGIAGLHGLLS